MADYAGAVAAIKALFASSWTATAVAYQNQDFADQTGPWVYFEVISSGSTLRGIGTPGSNVWLYWGNIFIHVFVPLNYGDADAHTMAVAAGEIFRSKQFYDTTPGFCVRTGLGQDGEGPQTDGGGSDADNGNWWRVTCRVPFEYYHRG